MNETEDQRTTVQDDKVVTMDYTLKVDGEVVDSSDNNEPIQFIQGQGQIIPGLERQLYGMTIGESKNVVVPPGEGYGEVDSGAYTDIPRSDFPPHIPLETGIQLQLRDQNGEVMDAYITEVRDEDIRLNFNHPLAGKELHFAVSVVDVRNATAEELAHGHVHGEAGEEDEFDEDEEDEGEWDEEEFEIEEFDEDEDDEDLDAGEGV
ncbi:MAG TPA: peptidylprolyl isomerase [Anaerolineales bacterium]